ncbi:MAG: DsbA family protein [Alphaproteobacteria bacterium]
MALGGAVAWRLAGRPALPELAARRRGDLVFLEGGGSADLSRSLEVGMPGGEAAEPVAEVDRAAVEAPAGAQVLGDEGPSFVAFLDYRCVACRRHADALLAGARAGRFRLIVRDWPILGEPSVLAARAAMAAAAQGAYWDFHAALMATGFVPTPGLVGELAERHGLDRARLRADMDGEAVRRDLAHNAALAHGLGGVGTPLYAIDGVVVTGAWEPATLLRLAERHAA